MDNDRWAILPVCQLIWNTTRQLYRWCVEEHLSSYAIHRRLTAQGIPPRKSPRGQWAQSRVIDILRDSIYKREAYDNRTQPGDLRRP